MKAYKKLLENNKEWVRAQNIVDPTFFHKMEEGQNPDFLWIGCADSRAPADRITNTQPGQIFVHRNIANLVVHTDVNMLSVLQYAVEVLKVKHIMVVGHYGCAGIKLAVNHEEMGLASKWVSHIKDVYCKHQTELNAITKKSERLDRLCEINVIEQAKNLMKTSIIQKAWRDHDWPHIHGWVLELKTGTIKQIYEVESGDLSAIEPIYRYDL